MKRRLAYIVTFAGIVASFLLPGPSILGQTGASEELSGRLPSADLCTQLLTNTSFETREGWQRGLTPRTAQYVADTSQHGSWSMLLGTRPPTTDTLSHSSAYQSIRVPANATWVQLAFWFKPFSEESAWRIPKDVTWDGYTPAREDVSSKRVEAVGDAKPEPGYWNAYDWQEALILSPTYGLLEVVMRQRSNSGRWGYWTHDLSAYRGQDIVIYFNVYNNGWGGRRTWMYVDDVSVLSCDGILTATPTPTSTPTSTPPPPACTEVAQNGSFEGDTNWTIGLTPRQAMYATDTAHSGARSMLLGIRPPAADAYSYSSARQSVYVPMGATSATLSFWYKPHTEEKTMISAGDVDWAGYDAHGITTDKGLDRATRVDPKSWSYYDWQECLILDPSLRVLEVVMRESSDAGSWRYWSYDLSAYRGQHIIVYFNVYNDGEGGLRTWMYLDDVSVEACGGSYRSLFLPLVWKYWPTLPPETPTPLPYP